MEEEGREKKQNSKRCNVLFFLFSPIVLTYFTVSLINVPDFGVFYKHNRKKNKKGGGGRSTHYCQVLDTLLVFRKHRYTAMAVAQCVRSTSHNGFGFHFIRLLPLNGDA